MSAQSVMNDINVKNQQLKIVIDYLNSIDPKKKRLFRYKRDRRISVHFPYLAKLLCEISGLKLSALVDSYFSALSRSASSNFSKSELANYQIAFILHKSLLKDFTSVLNGCDWGNAKLHSSGVFFEIPYYIIKLMCCNGMSSQQITTERERFLSMILANDSARNGRVLTPDQNQLLAELLLACLIQRRYLNG